MEELKTTEVLDREILEDARKKAYKILKTADDTVAIQKREWEEKIHNSLDSIRKVYSQREKTTSGEIFARLPLDKRRFRSESAEGFLSKAMYNFLRSLKRETLLSILEKTLAERLEACTVDELGSGQEAELKYSGMDLGEAKQVLEKAFVLKSSRQGALGSKDETQMEQAVSIPEIKFIDLRAFVPPCVDTLFLPFIEINTKALKITASVEGAAAVLLKEKRSELAAALLGEGVLND